MQVSVGFCDSPDSVFAGRHAATKAIDSSGRTEPCDLVLLFSTARHDYATLRSSVAEVTRNNNAIFGGGASGIITGPKFGYGGDQVGVACFWFDGSSCHSAVQGELSSGEKSAGEKMGKKLTSLGIKGDEPVFLFYDGVNHHDESAPLILPAYLLEGIENGMGFLPRLIGGGLLGNHIFAPSMQFLGDSTKNDHAFALTFSDDISVNTTIFHGCSPASPYFTVTRAEGSVILEIDGTPALDLINGILGPSVSPEEYPFFLVFGVSYGEEAGEYDEDQYANRFCQAVDYDRNAIVMSGPEMTTGTIFQIMYRSFSLEYMRPKIEGLIESIGDKDPFFALYINCSGRSAGNGGREIEDAREIQKIVGDRFPLFGVYLGGELAPVGDKTRSLNWTGVFCLFSKDKGDNAKRAVAIKEQPLPSPEKPEFNKRGGLGKPSRDFFAGIMARMLALDAQAIAMRYELEHKRRGFSLLAELSISLRGSESLDNLFELITKRINSALNMHKTALFLKNSDGYFAPFILQGFTEAEKRNLMGKSFYFDEPFFDLTKPLILSSESDEDYLADFKKELNLPYFISVPVAAKKEASALLIAGRMVEAPPFFSRLSENEGETIQAIAALLGSVMVHKKLDEANQLAGTDGLTGLFNRRTLERRIHALLAPYPEEDSAAAFIT